MGFVLGLFKFFTSKLGAYSLIALVVLSAAAYENHHIKAVQKAEDKVVSDKEEAKLNGVIAQLKKQIQDQNDANAKAMQDLKEASDATIHAVQSDLDAERAKKQKVQIVTKEVTKYVTAKADNECIITDGFVWMHNVSLRQSASLADSAPRTPDAATGIKISDVATTIRDNYAECEERGVVIEGWQKWYNQSKLNFDKAVETEHVALDSLPSVDWSNYLSYQAPRGGAGIETWGRENTSRSKNTVAETSYSIF